MDPISKHAQKLASVLEIEFGQFCGVEESPEEVAIRLLLGHRWPKWKRASTHTEERNCERCKLLGVRGPAWTVLP
jgi:hypothetical protein